MRVPRLAVRRAGELPRDAGGAGRQQVPSHGEAPRLSGAAAPRALLGVSRSAPGAGDPPLRRVGEQRGARPSNRSPCWLAERLALVVVLGWYVSLGWHFFRSYS